MRSGTDGERSVGANECMAVNMEYEAVREELEDAELVGLVRK